MAKLYFKYGAMGSSKSAQALITQFNYEELGMRVWLIKPSVDNRDGAGVVRSRIGLSRAAENAVSFCAASACALACCALACCAFLIRAAGVFSGS